MSDLQNSGYYDVVDPDELEFVFGEIASDIIKKSGVFRYPGKGRDYSAVYYYDDGYFTKSAYNYNPHLATMSFCLELSACGSQDVGGSYENKSLNAQNLLAEIGFSDIETNEWFEVKPTKDSIGAIAAHKTIKDGGKPYELIALAVRGGGMKASGPVILQLERLGSITDSRKPGIRFWSFWRNISAKMPFPAI